MKVLKLVIIMLVVLGVSGIATAQEPPVPDIPGGTIVASGLNGPQGILVDPDGYIWVIDSGVGGEETIEVPGAGGETSEVSVGNTTRITQISPDGTQADIAMLPSVFFPETQENAGGARLAMLDGVLYATSGVWSGEADTTPPDLMAAVVRIEDGNIVEVTNTWAYESANNPDGLKYESHPYGITVGPDGWLWIADAGANALLRVDPASGEIALVAAFDGLPGGFPNPERNDAVEADPVPTAVAFDDEGNAYVSLLSGAPFIPGNAKVLRVTPEGEVSDFATNLTTLTDLTRGPDGELYAIHFGQFTESGLVPNSGAVVRIKEGTASEIVVSGLPFPTAISFDADGNAYVVVNGVGAPGSGAVVRFDALTGMAGEPIPAPAE